jgi:hypothetical protein
MTGNSLHMQWPLTSQLHGSVSQREQNIVHFQDQLAKSVIHGDLNEQNLLVRAKNGADHDFEIFRWIRFFTELGYSIIYPFRQFHTWGRCYDHNFLRFLTIFCEKMAFLSKTNVMIKILHNLALF